MKHKKWLGAIAVASLLITGCATSAPATTGTPAAEASEHTMADGTVMSGAEHQGHETGSDETKAKDVQGPSEAARMVCSGQVVDDVANIMDLQGEPAPSSSWDSPMFTCTYDVDGGPLVLSVHDATDETAGDKYFAELKKSFDNAEDIKGMAGLGMPSFSTGDGIVAFLRDGKTLLVDATALPGKLGLNGSKTQHEAAYAVASAVLLCWVEHN